MIYISSKVSSAMEYTFSLKMDPWLPTLFWDFDLLLFVFSNKKEFFFILLECNTSLFYYNIPVELPPTRSMGWKEMICVFTRFLLSDAH